MRLPAKLIPIFLLCLLVFTILLMIATARTKLPANPPGAERSLPAQLLEEKAQRPLDDAGFSQKGYIVPLESNATGLAYSSRAQVRVISFFPEIRLRWIEEDEIKQFDPELLAFMNCNTPEELEAVKKIWTQIYADKRG